MSLPLVRYVFTAAFRDKLIISLLLAFIIAASLATFLGSSAIIEKDQFTVIFAAAAVRILCVFWLVLFVVFFVRRSFESKDIEYLLSRPISRLNIIFSYAVSFSLLSVLVCLASGLVIYSVSPHLFGFGHVIWLLTVLVESIIMVNVALFFAMYISSAAAACMATLGVYVLGRLMGQLLGIVDSSLVDGTGVYAMALQLVSFITPRLDLLGQTSWLIYGFDNAFDLIAVIIHGVIFSLLVLLAASLDFVRRQF